MTRRALRSISQAAAFVVLVCVCAAAGAQASSADASNAFSFTAVSIRPAAGEFKEVGPTPDGFSADGVTLRELIFNCFDIQMPELISGLPPWGDTRRFTVEAKMDEQTAAALHKLSPEARDARRNLMLQAMLADRFALRFHLEKKQLTVYALVVGRGGAKLKPSPPGTTFNASSGGGTIIARAASMDDFVSVLSDKEHAGRVVLDRTGLSGRYDFSLRYTPDAELDQPNAGPGLATAIQEQLGLKLQTVKAPVDSIAVEHVEPPTEN